MKYQKLENQEANWKWIYLIRKYREGENITRYEEKSLQESVITELLESQNYPEKIESWIKRHLSLYRLNLIKQFAHAENAFLTRKSNLPKRNPSIWNTRYGNVLQNIHTK